MVQLSHSCCPTCLIRQLSKNPYFCPKQSNRMDLCCIKGLLEQFSCLLTSPIQLERCEGHFVSVLCRLRVVSLK